MTQSITHDRLDSIKLTRGTTGKYGWEIKLYFDDEIKGAEAIIERISVINGRLEQDFKIE